MRISKRLGIVGLLLLSVSSALPQSEHATQNAQLNSVARLAEFVQDWKISRQFTLDVADAMPAEFYTFKPNPEEMTFGEQMIHIAGANVYRFHEVTGIKPPFKFDPAHPPATDKQSVIRTLRQSFDYVLNALPQIKPEQLKHTWHIASWKSRTDPDGRGMIMNVFVHTAHHRAQCEVYIRGKGIKPPDYTF
jgi:uncharacterized damage-inducible protein DinB